jgi:hypothetical protein
MQNETKNQGCTLSAQKIYDPLHCKAENFAISPVQKVSKSSAKLIFTGVPRILFSGFLAEAI